MFRQGLFSKRGKARAGLVMAVAILFVCSPQNSLAWGNNAQKLIINHAVDTLPYEARAFFEANRDYFSQHVNDTLNLVDKNPAERNNHFIELDKYGKFPFDTLPRSYQAATTKYSKSKINSTGVLPWQIGVYSQKLTDDLRNGRWDDAKRDAAFLANYVAEAHDPFNTTENFDGKLSGQSGINDRFNTVLIDRYGSFFPMSPHDASFISDPTDHAFESCLSAHTQVESILLADRKAKKGLTSYTDEYYDRFYNLTAAELIKQLSSASNDVGSYWLTAWINAGRPSLPH